MKKERIPWATFIALSLGMLVFGLAESYGPVTVADGVISSKHAWLGYSLPYIFGGIGSLLAGYLTDRLGRKKAFVLTSGLIVIGLLLFIPVYFYNISGTAMLALAIVSMALVGMAAIGLETPVLVTMAESVASSLRGRLLVLAQNFGNLGVALAFVPLLFVHGDEGMNLSSKVGLFLMYIAPLAAMVIAWLKANESLPWQAVKEKKTSVHEAWKAIDSALDTVKPTTSVKTRLAILMAIGIAQNVAFVYIVYGATYLFFANSKLFGVGVPTLIPMVGGFLMTVIGIITGLFIADRVDRRNFAVWSFGLLSVLWALLMAVVLKSNMKFTPLVFLVYSLLFIPLETTWASRAMLEPELFPTKLRGTYVAVVQMVVWAGAGFVTLAMSYLPSLTSSFVAGATTMLIVSLIGTGAAVAWKLIGFETRGRSLLGLDIHGEGAS